MGVSANNALMCAIVGACLVVSSAGAAAPLLDLDIADAGSRQLELRDVRELFEGSGS